MAKAKATKTAAEIKAEKNDLKQALKLVDAKYGEFVRDHKAAEKALAAAKWRADKIVTDAQKVLNTAAKKLEKASAAADKGRAKLNAQLAALSPAPALA